MKPKTRNETVVELDHFFVVDLIAQHESKESKTTDPDLADETVDASDWPIGLLNDWLAQFDPFEHDLTHYKDEVRRRVVNLRVHRPKGRVIMPCRFIVDPKTFGKKGLEPQVDVAYKDIVEIYGGLCRRLPIERTSRTLSDDIRHVMRKPFPEGFPGWPADLRAIYRTLKEAVSKRKRVHVVRDDDADMAEHEWKPACVMDKKFLAYMHDAQEIILVGDDETTMRLCRRHMQPTGTNDDKVLELYDCWKACWKEAMRSNE